METSEPLGADFESGKSPHWPSQLLRAVLAGLLCALLGLVLIPGGIKTRAQSQLVTCRINCKNLSTALEAYAADNKGQYPAQLSKLTRPNHLTILPTCPAAGKDTYSGSYRVHANPGRFSFCCQGNNHSKAYVGFPPPYENFPQYSAEMGLVDRP